MMKYNLISYYWLFTIIVIHVIVIKLKQYNNICVLLLNVIDEIAAQTTNGIVVKKENDYYIKFIVNV